MATIKVQKIRKKLKNKTKALGLSNNRGKLKWQKQKQ